jgi:ElaB/YqjD/DUF883 family membrane-anchored ribosome-binding protein
MTAPAKTDEGSDLETLATEQLAVVRELLEERPLVAVAIGVGIGILLARLLGDR